LAVYAAENANKKPSFVEQEDERDATGYIRKIDYKSKQLIHERDDSVRTILSDIGIERTQDHISTHRI
jgi:hypothetical protein